VHHELLRACLPLLIALAVLCAIAQIVLRLSGARLHLRRLRDVHRCEAGGVQSLAFVLTLPIFLMVVMFIVQIGLMMVGLITVNTAAFAAARSAAVWIPAYLDPEEPENVLPGVAPGTPFVLDFNTVQSIQSPKHQKIFEAAALACVPIAPSRAIRETNTSVLGRTSADDGLVALYPTLVPSSTSNRVMPQRLRNKLAYSLQNTRVILTFLDKNSGAPGSERAGPTYNPYGHELANLNPPEFDYDPSEVGWQDPVTIEVRHQFRLLPGAGRFLARLLRRYDGRIDDVAPMIQQQGSIYTTELRGSATLTVEGLKSIRPHVQQQ
jgi:hypothetical protein